MAKKRSELAYEIVRRVARIDKGFWSGGYSYEWDTAQPPEESYDDFLKRIADSEEHRQADQLKAPMDELEILAGPAHIIFDNYGLDAAIDGIVASTRAAKSCFDRLADAAKVAAPARTAKWQADVDALAKGLLFSRDGVKESDVKPLECGDLGKDVSFAQHIKKLLMPEIEMTGKLGRAKPERWTPPAD